MIDGTGNYADDPAVWAKSEQSSREVDGAIDDMIPYLRNNPDPSLLSGLASMPIPLESIRANLKMTIGGGLNEPRDVLATTVWALLSNPEQLADVLANPKLHSVAFEESVRWVAPIGMYPRQTTRETVLEGVRLPARARLGVVLGAANRDPAVFTNPETFNIHRPKKPHLGFGGGAHFCAGTWIARAQVAQIAMPALLDRLPNMRLDPNNASVDAGWVFRGLIKMPWFWSTQGSLRLQMAGIQAAGDTATVIGNPETAKFSVLCHRAGRLVAEESVNAAGDHIAARKLLTAGLGPSPEEAQAPGFSLKAHAQQALLDPA